MVSGPTATFQTPVMNFRPDPGEPALRVSAPQQETALLVTAQELRNETRLRSQALVRGEDILYSSRTFTLGIGQISPVFAGGLTTVVSRTDENGFLPNGAAPSNRQLSPSTKPADESETGKENSQPTHSLSGLLNQKNFSEGELKKNDQELENEDTRLSRSLARAHLEQNRALGANNPVQLEQTKRKESNLLRQIGEVEKEKRGIELEKMTQNLEKLQAGTGQAILDSLAAATGILDVMFGLGQQQAP